jgi:hypothetical protein
MPTHRIERLGRPKATSQRAEQDPQQEMMGLWQLYFLFDGPLRRPVCLPEGLRSSSASSTSSWSPDCVVNTATQSREG